MNERTYTITTEQTVMGSPVPILTIKMPLSKLPYNVWRDVSRLAGHSMDGDNNETKFCFVGTRLTEQQARVAQAEEILKGALFTKVGG